MQKLIDRILPGNCRKELYIAFAKNAVTAQDTLCILQDNRSKLKREMKSDQS